MENAHDKFCANPKEKAGGNFDYVFVKHLDKRTCFSCSFLNYICAQTLCRFSQLLNWTAGISETGTFLKMDLNLESQQGQSIDLNLPYPEGHEMFLVLSFTQWDTFSFHFRLAEKIIIICRFYNLFFEPFILYCSFLLKARWINSFFPQFILWHLFMSWQIDITSDFKPLHTKLLRGKWLKTSKRLKLYDYNLKPKFKPYLKIFSITLVIQYFHLTSDFTWRAKHKKWIFT